MKDLIIGYVVLAFYTAFTDKSGMGFFDLQESASRAAWLVGAVVMLVLAIWSVHLKSGGRLRR